MTVTPQAFTTILADPPWAYDQPLKMKDGVKRSSASQYATMRVQEICDLYQPSVIAGGGRGAPPLGTTACHVARPAQLAGHRIGDPAFLWLWITGPLLLEGVHMRVCQAWGFTPKQIVPWIKGRVEVLPPSALSGLIGPASVRGVGKLVLNIGMGAITRGVAEYLVVATRGQYTKLVQSHGEAGLLLAEEDAVILEARNSHSTKPAAQYRLIERTCPGPYLELFARRRRDGWTSDGLELPAAQLSMDAAVFDQAQGLAPQISSEASEEEWP